MAEHNIFAIAENGQASVTLKICDVDGHCGSIEHQIYFGPFMVFSKAERESLGENSPIVLRDIFFGNTGKKCQFELYLAVLNEGSGKIWTRSEEELWWLYQNQDDLKPWRQNGTWEAGYYDGSLTAWHLNWSNFGDGELSLFIGALDKTTNEWALDFGPIKSPQ